MFAQSSGEAAAAGVGIVVLLFFVVVSFVILGWYIWLLLDILKQPDYAWTASAQNKQLWTILWVVGICSGFSLIIGLIYQFAIRPKVKAAADAGTGATPGYIQ